MPLCHPFWTCAASYMDTDLCPCRSHPVLCRLSCCQFFIMLYSLGLSGHPFLKRAYSCVEADVTSLGSPWSGELHMRESHHRSGLLWSSLLHMLRVLFQHQKMIWVILQWIQCITSGSLSLSLSFIWSAKKCNPLPSSPNQRCISTYDETGKLCYYWDFVSSAWHPIGILVIWLPHSITDVIHILVSENYQTVRTV